MQRAYNVTERIDVAISEDLPPHADIYAQAISCPVAYTNSDCFPGRRKGCEPPIILGEKGIVTLSRYFVQKTA